MAEGEGLVWESNCDTISELYWQSLMEIAEESENGKYGIGKVLQKFKYQYEQQQSMDSFESEYETLGNSPLGVIVKDEKGETFVLVPEDLAQAIFEQSETLVLDAEFREEELLFPEDFVEMMPIGSPHAKVFHGVRGEGEDMVDYIIQEESVDGEKCYRILLVIEEEEEPLEVYESAIVLRKKPQTAVERAMVNHMLIEQAEIEQAILELENAVRLGLVSEEEVMRSLVQRFGVEDVNNPGSRISKRNRIDFFIVSEGDTYRSLEKEFGMMHWELFKYNDLPENFPLKAGILLYLQPKRNKAAVDKNIHIIEKGETMHGISQKYGIKLDQLYQLNRMKTGEKPVPGNQLWLRKVRPEEEKTGKEKTFKIDFDS